MDLRANWIWRKQRNLNPYNQTVVARRSFEARATQRATLAITADSYYRLHINGSWVADGPCRSWPEHYQYDVLDVSSYLQDGKNEIQIIARYFGVGTFHQVPRQAGLLAQLEITPAKGRPTVICTDESWQVAEALAWRQQTPKICIQMEPFEHYDARNETLRFAKAHVLCGAHEGPWQDLNPRDSALLSREPVRLKRFMAAHAVRPPNALYCFPMARLIHPGLIEANHTTGQACVVATIITAPEARRARIISPYFELRVNGAPPGPDGFELAAGRNFLLAATPDLFWHLSKDMFIVFESSGGLKLSNPLPNSASPWSFAAFEESSFIGNDLHHQSHPQPEHDALREQAIAKARRALAEVTSAKAYRSAFRTARAIPPECIMEDPHQAFIGRCVVPGTADLVAHPEALMHDHAEPTVVAPGPDGAVELSYDLGVQRCGYYTFDLVADAGTIVDIACVEYVAPSGSIQHDGNYRNGLRYVCRQGANRFVSLKRRSGRYLYITLRNHAQPVRIRHVGVIESTYPGVESGAFDCSDPALGRLWDICRRTLKLCMEDVFTDCPLYEQTLYTGDMRNEALYAYTVYGADDLARRCLTLAGQSLERYPLVGCQAPSSWEVLLPAWSFLWGIAVWEYYFYSGDREYLQKAWPWVMQNLRNAEKMHDERGLFSASFWNLFDWAGQDIGHRTVTHNSLFIIGTIDAALQCAKVLGHQADQSWLQQYRKRLKTAANKLWLADRQAYADSVHDDGTLSPVTSQHTSFLALLYDAIAPENRDAALRNTLDPPHGMVQVGSPFAMMFLLEALAKTGRISELLDRIQRHYVPMLDAGATTVWESFAGAFGMSEFPTRSHCHAWSSAPLYFLNRHVLGIQQRTPGGGAFDISPYLYGLSWARGASASVHGPVAVSWRVEDGTLHVEASAPDGVSLRFVRNESHRGLTVVFNGRPLKK